jgi:BirA family biotin operon repressor/biotin-[acetyl-CoA-carboxylase] ligase
MNAALEPPPAPASAATADPAVFSGWILVVEGRVSSTNHLAARLPAWHAVRADTQTEGRGRTGRVWTSDRGGVWLSAVVPCPGPRERWATLPLAVGNALLATLSSEFGVSGLRLRWPNDILHGARKLAGLLVERHSPDAAVVGIGLNVFNQPELADPALHRATVRLADLATLGGRSLDDIAGLLLHAVATAHSRLAAGEFPLVAAELNQSWSQAPLVALTLAGRSEPVSGRFLGIDDQGRLRLRAADGATTLHDPTQVALLREL